MPDPCYPCNRHFVSAFGGKPVLPVFGAAERYQLTAAHLAEHWSDRTRGVMVASPSNPTGTSMTVPQARDLLAGVRARGGFAIVDEIYQGLSYGDRPVTALALDDSVITVNSFSKYFSMTGWRLGWLVVPEAWCRCSRSWRRTCSSARPPSPSTRRWPASRTTPWPSTKRGARNSSAAAISWCRPCATWGLHVPVMPDGAFYVYADIAALAHRNANDSTAFAKTMLEQAHVAIVPGDDFGFAAPQRHVRFSYATRYERIEEAVQRLARQLGK